MCCYLKKSRNVAPRLLRCFSCVRRIPTVAVSGGDGEAFELDITDDPYDCQRLSTSNVPVLVTLNKVCEHAVCLYLPSSATQHLCIACTLI